MLIIETKLQCFFNLHKKQIKFVKTNEERFRGFNRP